MQIADKLHCLESRARAGVEGGRKSMCTQHNVFKSLQFAVGWIHGFRTHSYQGWLHILTQCIHGSSVQHRQVFGRMFLKCYGDTCSFSATGFAWWWRPLSLPASGLLVPHKRTVKEQFHGREPKHKSGQKPVYLPGLITTGCSSLAFPVCSARSSVTYSLLVSLCSRMQYQIRLIYHNTSTPRSVFSHDNHEENIENTSQALENGNWFLQMLMHVSWDLTLNLTVCGKHMDTKIQRDAKGYKGANFQQRFWQHLTIIQNDMDFGPSGNDPFTEWITSPGKR